MADSNHNGGASPRQQSSPSPSRDEPRKEHPDRAKARREVFDALDRGLGLRTGDRGRRG